MVQKLAALAIWGSVLAVSSGAAPLAAQTQPLQYSISPDVRAAAEQAQTAIAQGSYPTASAYLSQASASLQTDGDRYLLATMQLDIANRTFNTAAQVAAINTLLASPLITAEQSAEYYYHRARISYHAQNLDAARADLQAAITRGTANPRVFIALASITTGPNQDTEALALIERAMAIHQTAGITVPVDWYRRAIHFAQEIGDNAKVAGFGQAMLAEHPSQRNWRDVLIQHRDIYTADPEAALDLWRLQDAANALTGEFDYRDYARVAHGRTLPVEIERIVQAGRAANMLDGSNSEIATLDRGTTRAAQSLRTALPGRAQSAASAATGANALAAANDYLALGDYAAAVPLYQMAIEKGSVDTELANLRLGMALARTGDAASAAAALNQVIGPRASIARLWGVYAGQIRPVVPPAMIAPTTDTQ
ncbi:hypothetical protein HFP51_04575 [Parasphingopyxis sp. CP4]|uniref:tetratricopeptide repeat protein n=1 Tax=Parasphingopyxis sp. CP4 TaxID=2724527 RepID=UPI0015A4BE9B|nr:hypothetical protein [Parasphingopyxis sp. CP4]QLC21514.1 hypothetical protein HFP51_04575 [Parasphingopyxis sp. CP4]